MTRIGIIGTGITGVTTAYALNERGYDVTIFDQHRYAGNGDLVCERRAALRK